MPNTTNFNWPTPADTDLVKDGAAAIRNLGDGVDTSLVDLKGGTTGQILSKASNADMDFAFITPNVGDLTEVQAGTGISVADGTGPIPIVTNTVATEFDAKGDLVVGTGSDTFDRLAVGTNGFLLSADSGETTGLKWQAAPSGGQTLLSTTTLSGSSITISSIDQTYNDLIIEIANVTATANYSYRWRPNGLDDSSNINAVRNIGSSTSTFGNMGGSNWVIDNNSTTFLSNSTANKVTIIIYNYASTTSHKNYQLVGSGVRSSNSDALTSFEGGTILFNSAISSIGILSGQTFNGGTVKIYGVK
jgi:hypothetical protein